MEEHAFTDSVSGGAGGGSRPYARAAEWARAPEARRYLRMLAALAAPVADGAGTGPPHGQTLDVWGEWERLRSAAGQRDPVSATGAPWAVVRLLPPSAAALRDALFPRDPGYQVVHFSCHGAPEGLLLEDGLGRERLLPTAEVVAALRGDGPRSAVRLVVLNACATEELARALVEQAGVACVIATRQAIDDRESQLLSERLYRRLAAGATAGAALEEARRALVDAIQSGALPGVGDARERAGNLLLAGDPELRLAVEGPAAPAPRFLLYPVPHNDPPQLPARSFVGRRAELLRLSRWLEQTGRRAFAISGVGGQGKTTLAVHAALRHAYRFQALVFASAKASADFGVVEVLQALAAVTRQPISAEEAADREGAIARRMNSQPVLLALDNLESVSAARAAELARALERVDPLNGSRVLLTLRPREWSRLDALAGQDRLELGALDEASALRLAWDGLEAQWQALRPRGDLPLDGPPELATWARSARLPAYLSRGEVAALWRLARLALLHPALINLAVSMVDRHGWEQTLRRLERLRGKEIEAALDEFIGQMVDDLVAQEPACLDLLHALLVFAGGAAERHLCAVALGRDVDPESDEAIDVEDRLLGPVVAASLLQRGGSRYDLLPPVRAYLERRRPPAPEKRDEYIYRHAGAYLAIVEDYDSALSEGRMTYNAPLEWSNVTAALERLAEKVNGSTVSSDERAAGLLLAYTRHGRNVLRNNYDPRRMRWLEAALVAAKQVRSPWDQANTLQAIGDVQRFQAENDQALASYEAALGLFRLVGDRLGEANVLAAWSRLIIDSDPGRSQALLEQALGLRRTIGDVYSEAADLGNYGIALLGRGDNEQALGYFQRARELFADRGLQFLVEQTDDLIARAAAPGSQGMEADQAG